MQPFKIFGMAHSLTLLIIIFIAFVIPWLVNQQRHEKRCILVAWFLSLILLINEISYYLWMWYYLGWQGWLQYALPLHFCGISVYLTSYSLLTRRLWTYELAYYLGLSGNIQALLTPALAEGFPSFHYVQFFIGHGGIFIGIMYLTLGFDLRPTLVGVRHAFQTGLVLAILVGLINYVLDANYMFLCAAPIGASPFFFLPWPWYIPFLTIVALIYFLLLWLPFAKYSAK